MTFGRIAVKLGATSLILLTFTALIIVVFGQLRFDRTHGYAAKFSNASGIRPGQFVRAAGVEVGKVGGVHLDADGHTIVVTFSVDRSLPLDQSTRARIRYADLIGNRFLELEPGAIDGAAPPLEPGGVIPVDRTEPALDLDALIGGFEPLFKSLDAEKVNTIAQSLITVFQGQGGTVENILTQAGQLTQTLAQRDRVIGEVISNLNILLQTTAKHQRELDGAVVDLRNLIVGLNERGDAIADGVADIGRTAGTLADLLADNRPVLQRTVAGLQTVQQPLVNQDPQLSDLLTELPDALAILARSGGVYGDFFNFYLCDASIQLNGLQPGGPVRTVKLLSQPSGRCAPK
ncbi:MCE family protein [Mycobacterium sp. SMC-4]|uniref:MCE family protein n=1 Tax=Mycobacterium sp. SMC-4 TaxID=2857059 RepID=UPI0021B16B13|nr:MCE family protein [Mycobacterium sp. SMC-4]UXA18856.1 MCE family protein [Mycobacterium sp. SMC-4]